MSPVLRCSTPAPRYRAKPDVNMKKTNNMVSSHVNLEKTSPFNSIKAMIDARLCLNVNLKSNNIELEIKPAECPSELLTNYCRQQDGADGRAQVTWKNSKEPTG